MELAAILAEVVPDGHYVGGIVRNSLLKRQSGDIDITLPAYQVKQVAQTLAKRLNAASFEMDPELGVWRLVTHEDKIQSDLTAYQGRNLKADLQRRDFAFNSLARTSHMIPSPRRESGNTVITCTQTGEKVDHLVSSINNHHTKKRYH